MCTAVTPAPLRGDQPSAPTPHCSSTWWAPMERVGVDVLWPFSGHRLQQLLHPCGYGLLHKVARSIHSDGSECHQTAEKLVEGRFSRLGVPVELHSDQGWNFESRVFGEVYWGLGVSKIRITPLHPQSDGLVGRFNGTLATQLAIFTSQHQQDRH